MSNETMIAFGGALLISPLVLALAAVNAYAGAFAFALVVAAFVAMARQP